MRVSESDNPAVVLSLVLLLCVDFHQTEVALTLMGQRMSLGADAQVGRFEGVLDGSDQLMVRDGTPTRRGAGCLHLADILQINVRGAAMQDEVGGFACRWWWWLRVKI